MVGPHGGWAIPVAPLTVVATAGRVAQRPVIRGGAVAPGWALPQTLSFDHTAVDGARAARFADAPRRLIETAAVLDHEEADRMRSPLAFRD